MDFSIIIINYKTADLTLNCVESLLNLNTSHNCEIIVIDNNSQDNIKEILESIDSDKVKLIINDKNLGFAQANNIGAKLAKGKYLLFLNSDTEVKEDIFTSAYNIFNNNPNVGLISPLIVDEQNNEQKNAYGGWPRLKNLIFNKLNKKIKNDIDWLSGCSLFIKKDLFKKINGFDENFFLYFEDIDLCKRASDLDYQCFLDRKTKVIHKGGKSIKRNKDRKKKYYKSQNYYFKKHYNKSMEIIMRIIRLPIKIFKTIF